MPSTTGPTSCAAVPQGATSGDYLIFLASLPRSGSTMLQRMLGAHSQVHTVSEPWVMLHPVYALKSQGFTAEYGHGLYSAGVGDFLQQHQDGIEAYYRALSAFGHQLYHPLLQQSGARYFLDKTPRYHLILPELTKIYPQAKMVLLLRNPLAVLASIIKTWVKGNWSALNGYGVDLLTGVQKLAEAKLMLGERAHLVRYESLVSEPDKHMRALNGYLDLEHEPEAIDYGNHQGLSGKFGDPTNVKRLTRPVTSFTNAWVEAFRDPTSRQVAEQYLELMDADALEILGYPAQGLARALHSKPLKPAQTQPPAASGQ